MTATPAPDRRWVDTALAWYFVSVWGSGFLATNALNILMRHGEATRVTSLIYLTPIIAVALEYPMFGVVPSAMSIAGIVVTCAGVYMVTWRSTRAPSPAAVD